MRENRRGGNRMARPGEWQVVDYDGNPLPGAWTTEQEAHEEGVCGRYLLSGLEARQVPQAGDRRRPPVVAVSEADPR